MIGGWVEGETTVIVMCDLGDRGARLARQAEPTLHPRPRRTTGRDARPLRRRPTGGPGAVAAVGRHLRPFPAGAVRGDRASDRRGSTRRLGAVCLAGPWRRGGCRRGTAGQAGPVGHRVVRVHPHAVSRRSGDGESCVEDDGGLTLIDWGQAVAAPGESISRDCWPAVLLCWGWPVGRSSTSTDSRHRGFPHVPCGSRSSPGCSDSAGTRRSTRAATPPRRSVRRSGMIWPGGSRRAARLWTRDCDRRPRATHGPDNSSGMSQLTATPRLPAPSTSGGLPRRTSRSL